MQKFKSYFLLVLLSLCNMATYAYDFEVNGLYYDLVSASDLTCKLVGAKDGLTSVTIPQTVTIKGKTMSVISMQPDVFKGNTNLTKLEFKMSIPVPDSAFIRCTNLEEVSLTNTDSIGASAFCECTNLKDLKLGVVLSIGARAFESCTSLKEIDLGDMVSLGKSAFLDSPIDSVFVPNTVTNIGSNAFSGVKSTVYLEDGKTPLKAYCISSTMTKLYLGRNISTESVFSPLSSNNLYISSTCTTGEKLESVVIGPTVTKLPDNAFINCTKLKSIRIPQNVTEIGINAFCKSGLTELILEDGRRPLTIDMNIDPDQHVADETVPSVIYYYYFHVMKTPFTSLKTLYLGRNIVAFPVRYCAGSTSESGKNYQYICLQSEDNRMVFSSSAWEKITIGPKVRNLCDYMFYKQQLPSDFNIPTSIDSIGSCCFAQSNISKLSFGTAETTIASDAFASCSSLKIVELGNSRIIGNGAFRNCPNLHKVDLGTRESLAANTFAGCTSLTWLSIGKNLTHIGTDALSGCDNLNTIGLKCTTPPTFISESELSGVNKFSATLYIPQGTTSAYEQATVWKDFLFKEEKDIPEFEYSLTKEDIQSEEETNSKVVVSDGNMVVKGDLTGAVINKIKADNSLYVLDLKDATFALDNKNAYCETGKRVESNWNDVDVVRGAPYYSSKYYTAPETVSGSDYERNSSGKVINVIVTYFCSDLTNAYLNSNLKIIKLPACLTTLGSNAISGDNLTDLYVYGTTPPTATAASFGNTKKSVCVLHVPAGCKSAYASATGWSGFTHIIEEESAQKEEVSDNYIATQPTYTSRKVGLYFPDKDAKYQWYKYAEKKGKVMDITNTLSTTSAWEYKDDTWCSNMHEAKSMASLIYDYSFKAGEGFSFDWIVSSEELFDQLQCYFNDELLFAKSGEQSGSFQKTFADDVSGILEFVYIKDNITDVANDNAQISNVKISSLEELTFEEAEAIEGETTNELVSTSGLNGEKVYCLVTLGDGKELKSDDIIVIEDIDPDLMPNSGVTFLFTNGKTASFRFALKPEITIGSDEITISASSIASVSYAFNDIQMFYFEDKVVDVGIQEVKTASATRPVFSCNNGIITVSGLEASERVIVYSIGGTKVGEAKADNNGKASIDISNLTNGVYVVSTDSGVSFKILKK